MKRRLFTVFSALSLLVCASVAVLWVRSYSRAEHFWLIYAEGGSELFRTDGGDFTIRRSKSAEPNRRVRGRVGFEYVSGPLVGSHSSPGSFPVVRRWGVFSYAAVPPGLAPHSLWKFTFPAWVLFLLALILPAWWTVARLRGRRKYGEGFCQSCGYDLRATPGRCPECGVAAEGRATT